MDHLDELMQPPASVDSPRRDTTGEEAVRSFPSASLLSGSSLESAQPGIGFYPAFTNDDDFHFVDPAYPNNQPVQHSSSHIGSLYLTSSSFEADSTSFPVDDAPPDPSASLPNGIIWNVADKPCLSCLAGGFLCYRMSRGDTYGQCASCVTLRNECTSELNLDAQLQQDLTQSPNARHATQNASEMPQSSPTINFITDSMTGVIPGLHKNTPISSVSSRFSQESIQILNRWLILHSHHPYPNEEDKAMLQRQTGLNKTQISNWLSNARRRGKAHPQGSTISHFSKSRAEPVAVPCRPGTPAFRSSMHDMDPLQRWVDSPPESEPASVAAIARAIASGWKRSSDTSPSSSLALADEETNYSVSNVPSTSSAGSSSASSLASAFSQGSGGSFNLVSSMKQSRGTRRRRKRVVTRREEKTSLITPLKPYQCTFCTDAFRTKHDWQRHEKSLHLSLERWTCAPEGPRILDSKRDQVCCVFCGKAEPDEIHMNSHHHTACKVRPLGEKTFYRKDHLEQHLKLVHNVKFHDECMKSWKITMAEVRSRCGFCGIVMDSWPTRVGHLAEHFKRGSTMADWKGDWGFEAPVLDMLENSIPPYLIEMERISPFPFIARCAPTESPRSAYELITLELAYFAANYKEESGSLPSLEEMQVEADRIIFASEVLSSRDISIEPSWLRDLLMGSEEIARQAQFSPLRQGVENRFCVLKINGKDNIFEQCPLELQLIQFVQEKTSLGMPVQDNELQEECCCIISRIEDVSPTPSGFIANWLVNLIMASTAWLVNFRHRAYLPNDDGDRSGPPLSGANRMVSTIHNYSRLEQSLSEYLKIQRTLGVEPTDEALKWKACHIIYGSNDGSNQTAAHSPDWLVAFRRRHSESIEPMSGTTFLDPPPTPMQATPPEQPSRALPDPTFQYAQGIDSPSDQRSFKSMMKSTFFLNDANCYRRLAQELTRFVLSSMSANNPNRHVPSDAEIQHQARWILFDCDDPWNQTAADNDEWLQRFKRDIGIGP